MMRRHSFRLMTFFLAAALLITVPMQAAADSRLIVRVKPILFIDTTTVINDACKLVGCTVLYGQPRERLILAPAILRRDPTVAFHFHWEQEALPGSFTADWTNMTLFAGSSPAPSQSSTMSQVFCCSCVVSSYPVVSMCQSATMWKFDHPASCSRTQFSSAPT